MKTFQELLEELGTCSEAREWASEMIIEEVVETCHRGDWLLWLAKKVNVNDRRLTLAKGLCANTVRHLMKDGRSIRAADAAIAYGKGEMEREELDAYAVASVAAYSATFGASASAAAYAAASAAADADAASVASVAASAAASTAADASASAAAYAAAASAYAYAYASASAARAAKKANQMQTANICREVIGQEIISKVNKLLNN